MKKRVIFAALAAVVMMATGAQAGWMDEVKARLSITNTTKQIQEYLPAEEKPRPELEIKDNGMLAYHFYKEVWREGRDEVTGKWERYKVREPAMWGEGAASLLYNPATKHMLVLLDGRIGEWKYRVYYLKAEPMQKLLDAMATHWEDYKAYIEKPTPEGEKKILAYADVQVALDSVKDTVRRKVKQQKPVDFATFDETAALAKAKDILETKGRGEGTDLDVEADLADLRKTDEREGAFNKFVYGEDMSRTLRGENMFEPLVTKEESAAGAATRVRLYYVGAWLHAITQGYQPKVFKTVKLKLVHTKKTFMTKREIPEIFAAAEKTATLSEDEQAFYDPKHVFKGTVSVDGNKMMAIDAATGKSFQLKVTKQLEDMVAIGELQDGGFMQFKIQDNEAQFVPSLKDGLKLTGRVVEKSANKKIVRIKVFELGKEFDFYVTDMKLIGRIPDHGIIEFTAKNMFIVAAEKQL